MGAHERNSIPASIAGSTEYPVGLQFDVKFDAFAARITTLPDSELRFHIAAPPPDFVFTAVRSAVGHHGIGRLQWHSGPAQGPVAVTGMDLARFEDGRIQELTVFVDPAGH